MKSQLNRCLEAANEQIAYAKLQGTYKQVKGPLTAEKKKCRDDAKTAMRGVRERHAAIAKAQKAQAAAAQGTLPSGRVPGQGIQDVKARMRAEQLARQNARVAQIRARGVGKPAVMPKTYSANSWLARSGTIAAKPAAKPESNLPPPASAYANLPAYDRRDL